MARIRTAVEAVRDGLLEVGFVFIDICDEICDDFAATWDDSIPAALIDRISERIRRR